MLIGRDRERERIDRVVAQAREGHSGALLLHGDPGIGKTALLLHAREVAGAGRGMRVLSARGIETESEIPFAGLWDLLSPLLDLRHRLPAAQAMALGQALALESSGTPARFAVPAAVLGLLSAAADDGPVLAVIDDVQWLDQPSVEAIVFAARRLQNEGIAMVLAAREHAAGAAVRPEADFAGIERLRIAPLDVGEATDLLRRRHGETVSGPVAADLLSAAAGNPLALVELPRALSDAQLSGREALPPVLPAGLSLDGAFRRQLAGLPAGARSALLVAAASDGGEDVTHVVAALRRLGFDEHALDAAEGAGIVGLEGARLRFRHPLLRSAAYHAASPPERRAAHRALAESAPEGAPSRAWHLAAAITAADEDVARDLEGAANDARRRGGHASAARAFARAAELTPAPGERARRLLEAAIDHVAAGALEQAEADADAALPLEADPLVRTGLQRIRAHVLIRSGRAGEGASAMASVASEVAGEIPPLGAAMLLEAALGRMLTGPGSSALEHARRAASLGAGVEIIEGVADVIMAHTLLATGDSAGAAARLAARVGFLLDADPPPGVTEAIAGGAHTFMWLEDFDRSQKILDRLIEVARNEGALARLCYPLTIRSQLGYRRGHWSAAYADAVEAARASAETGQESNLSYALQMMAEIEAGLGKFADARAHAGESLEIARRSETPVFGPYARLALGAVAAGDDDVEGAVAEYERAREEIVAIGMPAPCELFATVELVELQVRAGNASAAAAELARLETLVSLGHPPVHQAQLARCRGLVLDGKPAIEALRAAVELHGGSSTPFERARTELVLGERLRRDRQRTEARTPLRAALETFERLGARAWAERARSELRASGATSSRGEIPVADVLTPHELQVAMIVAKGATNKEAAAALFVSPKTVEHHLGQIYRKLDLRSRTELTALLSSTT